jgi:hypothetical protein
MRGHLSLALMAHSSSKPPSETSAMQAGLFPQNPEADLGGARRLANLSAFAESTLARNSLIARKDFWSAQCFM